MLPRFCKSPGQSHSPLSAYETHIESSSLQRPKPNQIFFFEMGWVAHSSNTGAVLSNMKKKSIIAPRYIPEEDLRKVDFVIQLLSVH